MRLRIKDLREDHDLLQKEISVILNITRQQYSLYENGIREIPMRKLIELAIYYNTSIDYIGGLTNIKKPYTRNNKNLN